MKKRKIHKHQRNARQARKTIGNTEKETRNEARHAPVPKSIDVMNAGGHT